MTIYYSCLEFLSHLYTNRTNYKLENKNWNIIFSKRAMAIMINSSRLIDRSWFFFNIVVHSQLIWRRDIYIYFFSFLYIASRNYWWVGENPIGWMLSGTSFARLYQLATWWIRMSQIDFRIISSFKFFVYIQIYIKK